MKNLAYLRVDNDLDPIKINSSFNERRITKAFQESNFSSKIFSIILSSYEIKKHMEFYNWLQNSVTQVLPHDMLLACWGDFEESHQKINLKYDATSHIAGMTTQSIFNSSENADSFMFKLHKMWLENDHRWLVINDLNEYEKNSNLIANLPKIHHQLNSLLVYGVTDVRGSNNCLYVFFSKEKTFLVQDLVMGLIMPHIDNVLRKIQHLEKFTVLDQSKAACPNGCTGNCLNGCIKLTVRETEIVNWVKLGKSDREISMILGISTNTVKSHLKHVFEKLNVTKRAQAVNRLHQISV